MNREQWVEKAVREAERKIGVPRGWWGTWTHVHGPGVSVRFGGRAWVIRANGRIVSRHDSRVGAIRKAASLHGRCPKP